MKTNAVRILDTLGISYELRSYAVDEEHLDAVTVAEKVAGRPVPVAIVFAEADAPPAPAPSNLGSPVAKPKADPGDLKAEALANSTVQAVLEIFPVDKTTIEER